MMVLFRFALVFFFSFSDIITNNLLAGVTVSLHILLLLLGKNNKSISFP